jgi:hypothetical protein
VHQVGTGSGLNPDVDIGMPSKHRCHRPASVWTAFLFFVLLSIPIDTDHRTGITFLYQELSDCSIGKRIHGNVQRDPRSTKPLSGRPEFSDLNAFQVLGRRETLGFR